MTKLYIEKKVIPTADLGAESTLPPIAFDIELEGIKKGSYADEDDGLFVNYGKARITVFPYRYQDGYTPGKLGTRDVRDCGAGKRVFEGDVHALFRREAVVAVR